MHMEKFKEAETLVRHIESADKILEAFHEYPSLTKIVVTNPGGSIVLEPSGFGKELIEGLKDVVQAYKEKYSAELAKL